mmetsp:Transcript_28968/g.76565  ORF Transcript_28968/g.76565 Transcript_28968/m.76565 type:complete len:91 (+) Transcript_28968:64-336(+)
MAEKAPEGDVQQAAADRSACRDCGEGMLDCFAFMGRGATATARGTLVASQRCAYPVKEAIVDISDSVSECSRPYLAKRPADVSTPTFKYG